MVLGAVLAAAAIAAHTVYVTQGGHIVFDHTDSIISGFTDGSVNTVKAQWLFLDSEKTRVQFKDLRPKSSRLSFPSDLLCRLQSCLCSDVKCVTSVPAITGNTAN